MAKYSDLGDGTVKKELHVFYVLDTSGSMVDAPIAALNDAMRATVEELAEISRNSADAALKLAVMEYNSSCRWVTVGDNGLEDAEDFYWTDLRAAGMTYLGAALTELKNQLSRNTMMKSATGNKVPVIIFMSDGYPNDSWEQPLAELQGNKWFQQAIKIAFALGDDADENVLAKVVGSSEAVIKTSDLTAFKNMIRIASVTASLAASTSRSSNDPITGDDVVNQVKGGSSGETGNHPGKNPDDVDIYSQDPLDFNPGKFE